MTLPIAVLVSGRGSNLQAVLDACASGVLDARVALVVSNRAGIPALDRAKVAGVPSAVFALRDYPDRAPAHAAMAEAIANAFSKLGAESRAQAVAMAIEQGIVRRSQDSRTSY